jgi:hypothetical protein
VVPVPPLVPVPAGVVPAEVPVPLGAVPVPALADEELVVVVLVVELDEAGSFPDTAAVGTVNGDAPAVLVVPVLPPPQAEAPTITTTAARTVRVSLGR